MIEGIVCSRELSLESEGELRHRVLARMVKKANRFGCGVIIRVGNMRVDGKNLMAVTGLDFGRDPSLVIETWGMDARECLWALSKIATSGLRRAFAGDPSGEPEMSGMALED